MAGKPRGKKVKIELPEGFPAIGTGARYYMDGWRYGTVVSIKGNSVRMQPPGTHRPYTVSITDVEIESTKA